MMQGDVVVGESDLVACRGAASAECLELAAASVREGFSESLAGCDMSS